MTRVLVDTSVWLDHFRRRNEHLIDLLTTNRALIHPMVLLELACGTPPAPRARTLADLERLHPATQASMREVRDFIERESLFGLGCGLVDMSLLCSTLVTPSATLWTLDKRLAALTARFGVLHQPALH
jgi:predicted nucleic acid-binding protein